MNNKGNSSSTMGTDSEAEQPDHKQVGKTSSDAGNPQLTSRLFERIFQLRLSILIFLSIGSD